MNTGGHRPATTSTASWLKSEGCHEKHTTARVGSKETTVGKKARAAPAAPAAATEGVRNRLTLKQEKFCHAYLGSGNANEAYRQAYDAAGMSSNAINVEAQRLLGGPTITLRLDQARAALAEKHGITAERVLAEYARIALRTLAISSNGDRMA